MPHPAFKVSLQLARILYDYISFCLSNNRIQEEQKLFLRINLHINAHKGYRDDFC